MSCTLVFGYSFIYFGLNTALGFSPGNHLSMAGRWPAAHALVRSPPYGTAYPFADAGGVFFEPELELET